MKELGAELNVRNLGLVGNTFRYLMHTESVGLMSHELSDQKWEMTTTYEVKYVSKVDWKAEGAGRRNCLTGLWFWQ